MKSCKVCILGAGISGLSLAYYIRKFSPKTPIIILEKKQKSGGVIGREKTKDFIFDTGPKTFKVSRSEPLLDLIYQLNLQDQIKLSSKCSEKRYLYYKKKLQAIPSSRGQFILSPLTRKAIFPLLKEALVKQLPVQDESVGAFARRRFGNYIADVFFDPLTLGIYAADMHNLSVKSCFPCLKNAEMTYGSVLKSFLKRGKKPQSSRYHYPKHSLLTLENGFYSLIEQLSDNLKDVITYDQDIVKIEKDKDKYKIYSQDQIYNSDSVVSALPLQVLKTLNMPLTHAQKFLLDDFKSTHIISVHMQFEKNVLPLKGFGYLIPSKEKEKILGVVFDSHIFEMGDNKTRLTVMMGGGFHPEYIDLEDNELLQIAREALSGHLKISEKPSKIYIKRFPDAIPQFPLYHQQKIVKLQEELAHDLPNFFLVGNYIKNGSLNGCIQTSKDMALKYFNPCVL